MRCLKCESPEVEGGLCRRHSKLERWGRNESRHDLGIIDFAFDLFPERFDREFGVADLHRKILWALLRDKPDWTIYDRSIAIAAPRGHAKTSWVSFIVPLYFLLMPEIWVGFKDEEGRKMKRIHAKYILLIGKSLQVAADRYLMAIRQALSEKSVMTWFGDQAPTLQQLRGKGAKDNARLMILGSSGKIVQAIGMKGQIRGSTIGPKGYRPDLVVADDPEDPSNTETESARTKNRLWLLGTVWPAVDTRRGRLAYIGNMVHADCALAHLMKNASFRHLFFRMYETSPGGEEIPAWPMRFPVNLIRQMRTAYEQDPKLGLRAFFREFQNEIRADFSFRILEEEFEYDFKNGVSWVRAGGRRRNVYVSMGIDPAISKKAGSSFSAIVTIGQDAQGSKWVLSAVRGKMGIRDLLEKHAPELRWAVAAGGIIRKGVVDEAMRQAQIYHADAQMWETAAQQSGIYDEAVSLADKMGIQGSMMTYRPTMEKMTKLEDGLAGQLERGVFILQPQMHSLKEEIVAWGGSSTDLLDALYLADRASVRPDDISEEDAEQVGARLVRRAEEHIVTAEEPWMVV